MKKISLFVAHCSLLIVLGCGRGIQRGQHIPVAITVDVPVALDTVIVIDEKEYKDSSELKKGSYLWDWGDVSTEVTIDNTPNAPDYILVKTKVERVEVPVILHDTIEVTVRDTLVVNCPPTGDIPPAPGPDASVLDWIWWIVLVVSALVIAVFGERRRRKE